jgi:3-oxoacyl-[acyl-carrier protein] reductase
MDLKLSGKAALITGGSKGIGLRTARAFVEEGANVGLFARGQAALDDAADELRKKGARVVTVAGDICSEDDAARFIDECATQLGQIDILINNAIRFDFSSPDRTLVESSDQSWIESYEGVVLPALRMTRLAVPHLCKSDSAAVVNISSISGWIPQLAGRGQYGSNKAAIIALTERMALELVHDGIRVNTVSPGSIIWPGGSWDEYRKSNPESFEQYERDGFPMGRLGNPEEVADVIVFTASPRANWINGRHIPVDGLEQPVPVREFRGW